MYQARAIPAPSKEVLVCIKCNTEVDMADSCTADCENDTIDRMKRPQNSLEFHTYTFSSARPWTIDPPVPPKEVTEIHRRETPPPAV